MALKTLFHALHPSLAGYLETAARNNNGPRFEARNFLLDEGLSEVRAHSYTSYASNPLTESGHWMQCHQTYLEEQVFLAQPTNGIPKDLDPARTDRCPETFRTTENFRAFGQASKTLYLLRVVASRPIAKEAQIPEELLLSIARSVMAARDKDAVDGEAGEQLQAFLDLWNRTCDLRPTYVSFHADHEELLRERGRKHPDWPNRLRDRLGLYHLDPGSRGGPLHVLVFRYQVSKVPKQREWKSGYPLAVPTVLDMKPSRAFCPAPANDSYGRVVDLGGAGLEPAREVLHPFRALVARELYLVGEVTEPVPADVWPARRKHLLKLREMSGREDYAALTDPELDQD